MNTPLVDWDADDWGGNVHVASWAPDPTHADVTGDDQ